MDGALWSGAEKAGMWPVLLSADGKKSPMTTAGPPLVKELNATDLSIQQPLSGGGKFSMVCGETNITFSGVDERGQPLHWAWDMVGGQKQKSAVQKVTPNGVAYNYEGMDYQIRLAPDEGWCQQLEDGSIRLCPDKTGKLALILAATR
jgi:hypothetical protein